MEAAKPRKRSPWPWIALLLLAAGGGAFFWLRRPDPVPAPVAAEDPNPLPPALAPLTPKLQPMLDRIAALAQPLGLVGWPDRTKEASFTEGWTIHPNPLANRVWGNGQVLWHATPDGARWDALAIMDSRDEKGEDGAPAGCLVFVKDAFGSPSLQKLGKVPYAYLGLHRGPAEAPALPGFPGFVRSGPLWSCYQTDEASGPVTRWAFDPSAGLATELFLERKADHEAGLTRDKETTEAAKAQGGFYDDDALHAAAHRDASHPSDLFVEDLAAASGVLHESGLVFFKLRDRGPYFTDEATWTVWSQPAPVKAEAPAAAPAAEVAP